MIAFSINNISPELIENISATMHISRIMLQDPKTKKWHCYHGDAVIVWNNSQTTQVEGYSHASDSHVSNN